jgi:hypothetical protein
MLVLEGREAFRIRTLYDAGNVLISMWPDEDGEKYVIAVKACLDAITGDATIDYARRALIEAAEEAGIAVITVVR